MILLFRLPVFGRVSFGLENGLLPQIADGGKICVCFLYDAAMEQVLILYKCFPVNILCQKPRDVLRQLIRILLQFLLITCKQLCIISACFLNILRERRRDNLPL